MWPNPQLDTYKNVGFDLFQTVVAEAQALQHSGGEVLGDCVAHRDDLSQQLLAPLGAEIERDPQLLHIVVVEAPAELMAPAVVHERGRSPEHVPLAKAHRIFDADDLGPEGGHPPGGPCSGQLSSEVADANVGQSLRFHGPTLCGCTQPQSEPGIADGPARRSLGSSPCECYTTWRTGGSTRSSPDSTPWNSCAYPRQGDIPEGASGDVLLTIPRGYPNLAPSCWTGGWSGCM